MLEIIGKKYLSEKEASTRYGYSQSWFRRARFRKVGPPFVQIEEHGRILYPLIETDEWFMKKMGDEE